MSHGNARLNQRGRQLLVERVVDQGRGLPPGRRVDAQIDSGFLSVHDDKVTLVAEHVDTDAAPRAERH